MARTLEKKELALVSGGDKMTRDWGEAAGEYTGFMLRNAGDPFIKTAIYVAIKLS